MLLILEEWRAKKVYFFQYEESLNERHYVILQEMLWHYPKH